MEASERLDKALVLRGLALSRERAKTLIKEGAVTVDGEAIIDPSFPVGAENVIALVHPDIPWVSRSALKLVHALDRFGVDPKGMVALDIGASTGGFTEVLLARGVTHVYALDVGHGQLAEKLVRDERVTNMEGMHISVVDAASFDRAIDLVTIDVSFVSLTKVLEKAASLMKKDGVIIALVKPQFEVGKDLVGKGVIKDPKLRLRALSEVLLYARSVGLTHEDPVPSPIDGSDGNKEFLALLRRK